ncbi:hypothetical protein B0O99DRAFT_123717 [Bisporella sp. PMI_857]|nr:hypothetical protein B0O99DRAFT_123717 [Bisporella sp. PMI_857]
MFSFHKFEALIMLLLAQEALSLHELLERTASTCGPSILTSQRIVTYEDIITISHSCYSYTVATPGSSGCPTYSCPYHPDCTTSTTTTLYVPPGDSCCAFTPTITTAGPCSTCQTGCKTNTITATITTTPTALSLPTPPSLTPVIPPPPPPLPTSLPSVITVPPPTPIPSYPPRQVAACTTTIFNSNGWDLSPTRTLYLWTITQTVSTDCHGCQTIVESGLHGVGPGV